MHALWADVVGRNSSSFVCSSEDYVGRSYLAPYLHHRQTLTINRTLAAAVHIEPRRNAQTLRACDMADSGMVREENPGQFHGTKQGWEDHVHQVNLKKGIERLDQRSANPNKNAVKKHGQGGKFTVDGPYHDEDYVEPMLAAMDAAAENPAHAQRDAHARFFWK